MEERKIRQRVTKMGEEWHSGTLQECMSYGFSHGTGSRMKQDERQASVEMFGLCLTVIYNLGVHNGEEWWEARIFHLLARI